MKVYQNELLAFIKSYTHSPDRSGQMTLFRQGGTTYPDPAKTSYNDAVSWTFTLTFGRGYFNGALVTVTGRWNVEHLQRQDPYLHNEAQRDLPLEEAVAAFLSDENPDEIIAKWKTT
jgi:hypothetical protein